MKLNHYTKIEGAEVGDPAKDVKVRWLIQGDEEGDEGWPHGGRVEVVTGRVVRQ